jgi:hypothetical protein
MYKSGINPVMIKPSAGKFGLVLSRLHIGAAGSISKLLTAMIYEVQSDQSEKPIGTAILDEEDVVDALGHLFNDATLSRVHLQWPGLADVYFQSEGVLEILKPRNKKVEEFLRKLVVKSACWYDSTMVIAHTDSKLVVDSLFKAGYTLE